MTTSDDTENKTDLGTEALEWAIAGLSALLVIVLFGFITFEALTSTDAPPAFSTRAVAIREHNGLHYVTVSVTNQGDKAAADATVTGTVEREGNEQAASATLDYAPAHSRAEVTLVFLTPIDEASLTLKVEGFREP